MATLKTFLRGESVTINFLFPDDYILENILDVKVYLGSRLVANERTNGLIECHLSSNDTKDFGTVNKLTFWLHDTVFGVQKVYVGDVCFDGTNAFASNDGIRQAIDIVVPLAIAENEIVVGDVAYNYVKGEKGDDGLSAYEVAVINGFVGTEPQWLASLQGVDGFSAYEIAVENGFVGTESEWLLSLEGADGNGIESITLLSTVGLVKTYRILFTDATTFDYSVSDGAQGIQGEQGLQGEQGEQGLKGDKGDTGEANNTILHENEIPTGLVNGSNVVFTLANDCVAVGSFMVNSVPVTSYTRIAKVITLDFAPATGSTVHCTYFENVTTTQDISGKQDKTDLSLATTDKTVVGAINEVRTVADSKEPAIGTKKTAFNVDFGTGSGQVPQGNDARFSDARPASDVYTWAKQATKPTYTANEVGAEPAKGSDDNFVTDLEKSQLHTHANKTILDNTQESFTTALKSTYDAKQNALGFTPENVANKGVNNGYAGLDSGGKVPLAQLPSTLLKYIGQWNASTNTPTLTNPDTSKAGYVYDVSVSGTQFGLDFVAGDWLIYNASGVPELSKDSDSVVSVNGQTGAVTITLAGLGGAPIIHNHSGQSINPDNVIINKTYTDVEAVALSIGTIFYNSDQGDWQLKTSADTYYNLGGEVSPLMKNGDSFTHLNGQPVYVSNGNGKFPTVKMADASSHNTSKTIAIATQDVLNTGNGRGRYCSFGSVNGVAIANVIQTGESDTLWVEGVELFLSTETGKLTTVAPTAPNHRVLIGYITDKSGANISIFVHPNIGAELGELHDVDLTETKTTPIDADNLLLRDSADSNIVKNVPFSGLKADILKSQNDITLDPTGFRYPDLTIVTGNGNRTISLTGTVEAYWRGVLVTALVTGYTSPAHGTDTSKLYFLSYDGSTIAWSEAVWTFDKLQIALAKYDLTNGVWYYFRECHGLMPWTAHKELHDNIGTYKGAGGTIPSASYVLNSTTASDRRFDIDATTINDEDLPTVLPALTSKLYSQFRLNGADLAVNTIDTADIVSLSTNNPYYNQLTGGLWQQTLLPANTVATVWLYALPVSSDVVSQKYRYLFVQPQSYTQATNPSAGAITTAVATEKNKISSELNLNGLISTEIVAIAKAIIVYTGGNWSLREIIYLTGSKFAQIGSPSTAAVTLNAAYLNSPDPEIETTIGAVTLKNGNALDSTNVLEIKNFNGVLKSSINGNGNYESIPDYGAEGAPTFAIIDWTLTSGWEATNAGGTALDKSSGGTSTATAIGGLTVVSGTVYRVSFTVGDSISGGAFVSGFTSTFGGNTNPTVSAVGTYTYIIRASNTNKLVFNPTPTGSRFSITSISIQPITTNVGQFKIGGDFIFGSRMLTSNGVEVMYIYPNGDIAFPTGAIRPNSISGGSVTSSGTITGRQLATTTGNSSTSTGAITLTLSSNGNYWSNTALTGGVTYNITSPVSGGCNKIFIKQGATAQTVTLSLTGVTWNLTNSSTTSTNTLSVTGISSVNNYFCIELNWVSTTVCFVIVK